MGREFWSLTPDFRGFGCAEPRRIDFKKTGQGGIVYNYRKNSARGNVERYILLGPVHSSQFTRTLRDLDESHGSANVERCAVGANFRVVTWQAH